MNTIDFLRLHNHKFYQIFKNNLTKNLEKTINLLVVKDGVLFTWNFQDNCILTLNIKAYRNADNDGIIHQNLLPLLPVLFEPETLTSNHTGSLIAVSGPSGLLVMELPARYPPYGAFDHNKELVYCRSYNLDERLFTYTDNIEIKRIKFHPASTNGSHLLVLTSDNNLRMYSIENSTALALGVYSVGENISGYFPGTKTTYVSIFGEVCVDFDFGEPELLGKTRLLWPVYLLRADGRIYTITIPLDGVGDKPILKGPLSTNLNLDDGKGEMCSLLCIRSNPELFVLARNDGTIYHGLVLPSNANKMDKSTSTSLVLFGDTTISDEPKPTQTASKELLIFENLELELGLTVDGSVSTQISHQIYLHEDESRLGKYFVTHTSGVHAITINLMDNLQDYISDGNDNYPIGDIFLNDSALEYVLCTKTAKLQTCNSVIGFALYYEPKSLIVFLNNGDLISLSLTTSTIVARKDNLVISETSPNETSVSPLKKMLRVPFDQYIQKILKLDSTQPIMKLPNAEELTPKDTYELLQRTSQIFRDYYFVNHLKVHEEIEKRIKALIMLKSYQLSELERMNDDKQLLQEKAEILAEKYEDMKDRQENLTKRCENLLVLVTKKSDVLSEAEIEFDNIVKESEKKVELHRQSIERLKHKIGYQNIQMENWKIQNDKKVYNLGDNHTETIKNNLKNMNIKIEKMMKEVDEYKKQLNLK